ncbi:hypothetical protein COCC4DRAFT_140335 [Bipolaris maydis ATCC 48331]|uniref:Uncharacterized protein n=2 Tax=Cochliobolus heterostrophus TaxID=5016 RepID=N4WXZ6_COCH4|nr:uncharacterized protein COCC4DRAFT_140335 [Bipolaris maydis ATCC 48331]ENI04310.1 hypothetical protein COCC4DRAFT_140335 [Bipolaris maydis ATCC 48331]KAJ5061578.1 hypothetical protein J3E74DRAFT_404859 [Bipolaris maydis]KAJ6203188.1 hypothetical protein J3E72DRAFT_369878 [Bipolaris maydis]KAJ6214543.1 hypothetical protein PSV09DRAFT_1085682 [Bipolaris maydis]
MSTDTTAKGWTDRQRLAYYFSLVEHSNVKLDFTNAPRPEGKSVGACRIMVDRLKGTLKEELAALRGSDASAGDTTPKKAVTTPRKRKAKAEVEGEDITPVKRERKKKVEDEMGEEEKVVVGNNMGKEEHLEDVV